MPVAGPAAALVLARTLDRRVREAWFIAVGSAVPEAAYASLACWGVSAVAARFPKALGASHFAAGLALAGVGFWLLFRPSRIGAAPNEGGPGRRGILVGLGTTLANPTLLLSWTAVVGALHSIGALPVDTRVAAPFGLGVGAGVVAWFALMIRLVEGVRDRVRGAVFIGFVRGIGALLVAGGTSMAVRALTRGL
jgi:threonine/homoserine/homoserine lactone efflux protein